jgi:predicted Zn-dependent peptidase
VFHVSTFPNGLRVATAEMPHMTSVSVGLWVGVGSRYEPAPLNGVCLFIEHLIFKGTRKRSAREISEAVEGIGGSLNAFTSEEATCFHARASHDRFDSLLEVLMDMRHGSRFDPADIAKEREVIKEEMAMYFDEPQHLVQELLNATMWPGHPLGRSITGTNETLDRMRRAHLVDYLRENYRTGSSLVVAAGRVSHRRVLQAIKPYVRRWLAGPRPSFEPAATTQTAPRLRLVTRKTEQTQLALGMRTCSRHDPRRFAVRLLNTILGENMSSRLFQVVREDHGLTYSIYSTPSFFEDTGDIVISAGLEAEKLPRTLRLIFSELRQLAAQAPSRVELRRAQDYVLGQINLSLENTESQMNWLGEQLLGYGRTFAPAILKRRIQGVTGRDIQNAAREFFRPDRLSLALVSPLKTDRHLRRLLNSACEP